MHVKGLISPHTVGGRVRMQIEYMTFSSWALPWGISCKIVKQKHTTALHWKVINYILDTIKWLVKFRDFHLIISCLIEYLRNICWCISASLSLFFCLFQVSSCTGFLASTIFPVTEYKPCSRLSICSGTFHYNLLSGFSISHQKNLKATLRTTRHYVFFFFTFHARWYYCRCLEYLCTWLPFIQIFLPHKKNEKTCQKEFQRKLYLQLYSFALESVLFSYWTLEYLCSIPHWSCLVFWFLLLHLLYWSMTSCAVFNLCMEHVFWTFFGTIIIHGKRM